MKLGEQFEFKFYEDMKNKEKARIKRDSRINTIIESGIALGVAGGLAVTAYISIHPESLETVKNYISNLF